MLGFYITVLIRGFIPIYGFLSSSEDFVLFGGLEELKRKIERYMDFGVLLSNPVTDKYHICLQNSDAGLRLPFVLN